MLKNRLSAKRLCALFLSFIFIMVASVHFQTNINAAVVNSLTNVSFESIANGIPADWSCGNMGTSATLTIDTASKYDYDKSVKIHSGSAADQYVIQKWYIPVTAGNLYQAGVYNKAGLTSGNGKINLYFYNSSYTYLKTVTFTAGGGTHDWQYVGGLVTIPANAAYVTYELQVAGSVGDVWWDAAEFVQSTQKIANPDFESWSGGIPTNWSAGNMGTGATMVSDSSVYYNDTKSAKVVCGSTSDQYVFQQWYIPVAQGDRYEVAAYHKTANWTGASPKINVYFYNSSYTYLSTVTFTGVNGTHDWSYVGGNTLVPDNATFATIELGVSGATGTVWWDTAAMGQIIRPIRDLGVLNKRAAILNSMQISGGNFLVGAYSSAISGSAQVGVVSDTTGVMSSVYDLTGTNSNGIWSMAMGGNGRAYIGTFSTSGTSGSLYSIDPANLGVPVYQGQPISGEKYIWGLTAGSDGAGNAGIYGGTSPGGKVFFYNTANSIFTNLGTAYTGCQYVRSIAKAPNGLIFCGLGTPARLVAYNPSSGTFSQDLIPANYSSIYAFTYFLNIINGKVAATLTANDGSAVTLIYDSNNLEQAPIVASTLLSKVIPYDPNQPNKVYSLSANDVKDFDVSTNTYSVIVPSIDIGGGFITGGGMAALNKTGYPGNSITAITSLGKEWHCSPSTGNQETVAFDITGYGMGIDSLASLGGKVYGGTYMLQELSRFDPSNNTITELGQPISNGGEIYSMTTYNNKLYMGSYTGAVLSVYDPSQAWNPGSLSSSNPRRIGSLDATQYRPYCSTLGSDNKIYYGTAPAYGLTGGALSTLDPSNDQRTMLYRFADEDVTALASGSGVIYGGTSLGKFFIWNMALGQITYSYTGLGGGYVTSIRVIANGDVYISTTNGYLFVYTAANGWEYTKQLTPGEQLRALAVGTDNNVYAISQSKFIKINSATRADTVLFNEGIGQQDDSVWFNNITVDSTDGSVYYGQNERLKVYKP